MGNFQNALLGVVLTVLFAGVDGFWRMSCGRIQSGRIDPIVAPGGVAGHSHTISGPNNFNTTSTFASMQAAYCTSCGIQADKSAYWTPQLYYRYKNGSYTDVPNGGTVVYYLSRGDDELNMVPFPPGFRMISGDSAVRSYDSLTLTYGGNKTKSYGNRPIADRTSFACLNYDDPTPDTPRFNNTNCPGGLRAQVHFQNCWDGVNLYKSDQSHVAYMSGIDTGVCPPTHPKTLPHLFFELIYSVNNVNQEKGGYFVFSNGDTTGFSFHGDFLNGWNPQVLSDAIKYCMGTGRAINQGAIELCPPLNVSLDPFFDKNCPEQPPLVNETVKGLLKILPGCNPPTGGPLRAAQNICPVQPKLNYVPNQDYIVRQNVKPGDKIGDYQYLGCAFDNVQPKTLQGTFYQNGTAMTVEACTSYCRSKSYAYSGVENGYHCYCGNALLQPIQTVAICSQQAYIVCNGNSLEYCGGQNIIQIFNDTKSAITVKGLPVPGQTQLTVPGGTSQATYAGCYPEPNGGRALVGTSFSNNTGMTLEMCSAFCQTGKYSLFGTEYGTECYCGNTITTSPVAQGNCSMVCAGDTTEFCGAGGKMSLWTLTGTVASAAAAGPTGTGTGTGTGSGTVVSPSSAIPVPSASGISYLNCYSEVNPRVLTASFSSSSTQSVDACAQMAQTLNYQYFGLEYASECLIGNVINPASTVYAATKCNLACSGNSKQFCGGSGAVSMYNNTLYTPRIPKTIAISNQASSYGYVGCYSEPANGRAIGSSGTSGSYTVQTSNLTVDACAALCFGKGYSWMGVEYGSQCYCNSAGITNGAALSAGGDNDCSFPCAGNTQQNCGASGKIAAYQLKTGSGISSSRINGSKKRMG